MTGTVADVVQAIESRGASVRLREDGAVVVQPKGILTPTEREVLTTMKEDVLAYLRVRALGVDWSLVSLYQLDRILEVSVPWAEFNLIIAPGCRIARDLRARDPKPGRVWCTCEVLDMLLSGVRPDDARKVAGAKLDLAGAVVGVRQEPRP